PQLIGAVHNTWIEHHVRYGDRAAAEAHLAAADAVRVPAGQSDTVVAREIRRAQVAASAGRLGESVAILGAVFEQRGDSVSIVVRTSVLGELAGACAEAGLLRRARSAAREVIAAPRAQRPVTATVHAISSL